MPEAKSWSTSRKDSTPAPLGVKEVWVLEVLRFEGPGVGGRPEVPPGTLSEPEKSGAIGDSPLSGKPNVELMECMEADTDGRRDMKGD
jgi:hypothetical protein